MSREAHESAAGDREISKEPTREAKNSTASVEVHILTAYSALHCSKKRDNLYSVSWIWQSRELSHLFFTNEGMEIIINNKYYRFTTFQHIFSSFPTPQLLGLCIASIPFACLNS